MGVTRLDRHHRICDWRLQTPGIPYSYIPEILHDGNLWFEITDSTCSTELISFNLLLKLRRTGRCTFPDIEPDTDMITEDKGTVWFRMEDGGRIDLHGVTHVRGYLNPDLQRYREEGPGLKTVSESGVLDAARLNPQEIQPAADVVLEENQAATLTGHDLAESP